MNISWIRQGDITIWYEIDMQHCDPAWSALWWLLETLTEKKKSAEWHWLKVRKLDN